MRSRTEAHLPGRCKRCYLKEALCLCAELPRVRSRTELVLLRHGREAEKSTNTGRIAALALGCPVFDLTPYDSDGPNGEASVRAIDEALAAMPAPALLFPDGPEAAFAPSHLLVLDGTWRQTRKLLKLLPRVSALPRLSLPAPEVAPERLRHAPSPRHMSTLEAIAAALALLEGEEHAAPLRALHEELVHRVLVGRGAKRGMAEAQRRAREPA